MPGTTGLEVEMSNPFRNSIVVATVMLAVLVAGPACRPSPGQQEKTEEAPKMVVQEEPTLVHDVVVNMEDVKGKVQWRPIEPVTARRGEGIRFVVREHTAWVLIPESGFRLVSGGSDWATGASITAFKVKNGEAVIMLDESFSDKEDLRVIHYSVLARHIEGQWEYVHGENPPPRMIVPAR